MRAAYFPFRSREHFFRDVLNCNILKKTSFLQRAVDAASQIELVAMSLFGNPSNLNAVKSQP